MGCGGEAPRAGEGFDQPPCIWRGYNARVSNRGERILVVDDEAGIRATLSGILEDEGYAVAAVGTAAEATARLQAEAFDAVLLDLWLPDRDGLELLSEMREQPVIVISGHGNVEAAVRATRLGAYDFLEKPLSLSRVLLTVQNALERGRLERELRQLSDRLGRAEPLLGGSPSMVRLKGEIATAAPSDSRILILGENGTGKELVARQIHRLSARRQGPFVEVNCAAIPEDLIESELFGHVRGAFTGAVGDRPGRFEQADGGTLFLDEIADMSLKTQARVLRVLQEQRFERVGGATTIRVDVRVLAATNKDLGEEIRLGRFREDLYFRLAVIPLRVPPLRERAEDVPALVAHFIALFAHELKRRPKAVDRQAMARLREYTWPGNVRELRNLVERMMIMAPGDTVGAADLTPAIRGTGAEANGNSPATGTRGASVAPGSDAAENAAAASGGGPPGADGAPNGAEDGARGPWDADYPTLRDARAAFERHYIERKLAQLDGNVSRTALALGLERSNLYRKMRAYGVEVERGSGAAAADASDVADAADLEREGGGEEDDDLAAHGPKDPDGRHGSDGPDGPDGSHAADGAQGSQGSPVSNGAHGPDGGHGADGDPGSDGAHASRGSEGTGAADAAADADADGGTDATEGAAGGNGRTAHL